MFTKKRIVLLAIIALLIVAVPIMGIFIGGEGAAQGGNLQLVTIWQIDGFEGGKGSRAQYIRQKAVKLFDGEGVYVNVVSLSTAAAGENLAEGKFPDIISCSPTFNAHIEYINDRDFTAKSWCYGSYCLLTVDENADFSDVNAQNTVVNMGKDNLVDVTSVLCGTGGATAERPENAYLSLLNGKYKYLLGTQRDIFRLKTRNAVFKVKKITQFNDLYQNMSIITGDEARYVTCKRLVEYITENNGDIAKLGLFSQNAERYEGEMGVLQEGGWDYTLKTVCGGQYLDEIKQAAANNDANKIKNLLK